jgi:ribonuclease BN (tRNA processing enzyme)
MMKTMQFEGNVSVPLEMWAFFSHVHWDHIQGIPFFEPMFIKGNKIHLFGEKKVRTCLEDTLKGQQQYPNFPISIEEININGAAMSFTDLYAGQHIHIGRRIIVSCTKLSHPDGVFCYKIEEAKDESIVSVVYATDTEHRNVLDPRLLKMAEGADVLIYDAQYTPDEYVGKIGIPKFDWGHSTYEFAVDTALEAGINHLVLFHHDPKHNDRDIDKILEAANIYGAEKSPKPRIPEECSIQISAAYEGMEIDL